MAVITTPFCTPDDVAGVWRPIADESERDVISNLISDASQMIAEIPVVRQRVADDLLSESTLRMVCKHMVRRVMINPSGLRQFGVSADDAQRNGTYDSSISTGRLYITDDEMARLAGRPVVGVDSGAFSIRPWAGVVSEPYPPDPWVPEYSAPLP
jgi:hypothetical protein